MYQGASGHPQGRQHAASKLKIAAAVFNQYKVLAEHYLKRHAGADEYPKILCSQHRHVLP